MVILSDHVDEEKAKDSSTTELVSLLSAEANTEKVKESMITKLATHLSVFDFSRPLAAKTMWQEYKNLTNLIDPRQIYRILKKVGYTWTHSDDPTRCPGPQPCRLIVPKDPRPPIFPQVNLPPESTSTLVINSLRKKKALELEVKISNARRGSFYTLNKLDGSMGLYTTKFPLHYTVRGSMCTNFSHMSAEFISAYMETFFFGKHHANYLNIICGGGIKIVLGYIGSENLEIVELEPETMDFEIKENYKYLIVVPANCWEQLITNKVIELLSDGPQEDIAQQLLADVESENKGALVIHFQFTRK